MTDDSVLPITDLTPDPANARRHPERNRRTIEQSLRELGAARSIVIDEAGTILAGNGTAAAAAAVGLQRVRVVDADGSELVAVRRRNLTPEQKRRLALADNRASDLSDFDPEALAALVESDPDALAGLFEPTELDGLLDTLTEAREALPPAPEQPPQPRARMVELSRLTDHPRNYRSHPPDQLAHLVASIEAHGFYRNVVVARDYTILSGHGVVKAARSMGRARGPVVRLDLDPNEPRALQILAGDNEVAHLGEVDDRALSLILKEIRDADEAGLLGTGYDDAMLANLVYVTRPASEIASFDAAAAWVGMPEYSDGERATEINLRLRFETHDDLARCLELLGLPKHDPTLSGIQRALSSWWPPRQRADVASLRFVEAEPAPNPDDDAGAPTTDAPAEQPAQT